MSRRNLVGFLRGRCILQNLAIHESQKCSLAPYSIVSSTTGRQSDAVSSNAHQRLQLMMIDGRITSGPHSLPSASRQTESDQNGRSHSSRKQLLMSSDGSLGSEDGDTSEGTSDEEETRSSDYSSQGTQLLDAALQHVKELGWSIDAVRKGAEDLGLSPAAAAQFERPQAALVAHFVRKCNKELVDKMESHKRELLGMRMSERIQTAVQWRLEMNIPYMSNWGQALAIQTSPGSLPTSLEHLSSMVDDIWYACGDSSADFSWYTKRATLAGVYAATEAFMLTDYTPGYADTWEALSRRMQDVAQLGKFQRQASQKASEVLNSVLAKVQQAMGQRADRDSNP